MLRTLVLPRTRELLGQLPQARAVRNVLHDTGDDGPGAHMGQAWHAAVDGQGPTLTCVEMQHPRTNERFVFNAYTSRAWASSGGYGHDPHAALIWDGGVAETQNPDYSVYDHPSYGPVFGHGHSLCVMHPSPSTHYILVNDRTYPAFTPAGADTVFAPNAVVLMAVVRVVTYAVGVVVPDPLGAPGPAAPVPAEPGRSLPFMADGDGPATITRSFGREDSVTVLLAGVAGSGKSTLGNWMASVISGVLENAFMSSANMVTGQCTTAMQRRPMFHDYAHGTALDGCGKELYIVDGKGYTNPLALSVMLSGRQRNGEAFDDAQPTNAAELLARPCDPDLMVMSVILPIRASVVVDPTNPANRSYLNDVQRILGQCQRFVPDEHVQPDAAAGRRGYQIQVIPVITCLDEVAWFHGMTPRCLGEESDAMTRLTAACTAAGIDTRSAVFLGWLRDSPHGGFGDLTDPRVKAVWTLLCRGVRSAVSTKAQMR